MATALAVAYLLVLQAFIGGIASGAHAAGGLAGGELGQIICRGIQAAPETPASPADPAHHTPDCCTTGCQMAVGAAAPPPVPVVATTPARLAVATVLPPDQTLTFSGLKRSPRLARAPPLV
ncbi:hypothetical protein [Ancylobacter radicis]|nr:hypothetical protein [Ancylobacter radicis]